MGFLDSIKKKISKKTGPTEEELETMTDLAMVSGEEKYTPEEEEKPEPGRGQGGAKGAALLERDLELARGQIEALKQYRQISDEKFARLNEEIGELRAMLLESEKSGREMKLQAEKASALVEAVQPEKLSMDVKKIDAKIEVVKGMVEKVETIEEKLGEEMKIVRNDLMATRGTETLLQLNEEVKGELSSIKKLEAESEKHADKVEFIFVEFQKRFEEYLRLANDVKSMFREINDTIRDVEQLKVQIKETAQAKELAQLRAKVEEAARKTPVTAGAGGSEKKPATVV
ncbi:MAG: hypothetical protein NTY90_04755 [Candidatus Micrarchaeota archaeon]|nr:hypothetical protein [Candidatus Micrarchaeota archaeon]